MITIIAPSRYKIHKKKLVSLIVPEITGKLPYEGAVLNVVFIGTRKMKTLSNTYKKENVALPVLSFPYFPQHDEMRYREPQVIGEVIICFPQAVLLAAEKDKHLDSMLSDLILHGIQNILNAEDKR